MRPEDVISPRNRVQEGSVKVIYTDHAGDWSIAELVFDEHPAVGIRWNGIITDPEDKGNPRSHSQGTWFILPDELGFPIAKLATVFQQTYADPPEPNEALQAAAENYRQRIG